MHIEYIHGTDSSCKQMGFMTCSSPLSKFFAALLPSLLFSTEPTAELERAETEARGRVLHSEQQSPLHTALAVPCTEQAVCKAGSLCQQKVFIDVHLMPRR